MNTETLIRSNHKLRRKEVIKRFMFDMTVKFYIFRMNNAKTPDVDAIVVMPSFTYIPRKIWLNAKNYLKKNLKGDEKMCSDMEVTDKIMKEYETEYTYSSDLLEDFFSHKIFNCLKWRDKGTNPYNDMMIYQTEAMWYFNLIGEMDSAKVNLRFWPYEDEKRMIQNLMSSDMKVNTPIGNLKRFRDLSEMLRSTQLVYLTLDKLCDLYFNKKKKWKKNEELFRVGEDYMTTITNTVMGDLNLMKVDYFNRARHEIFLKTVISLMGEDPPDQSDVDLPTALNYTGPMYYQTPDYLYQTSDKLVILDFAVTGADPGKIRDKKIKKYHDLSINLEQFTGKPVEVEAVVWKINAKNSFFIPPVLNISSTAIWEDSSIQTLKKIYMEMETKDKFNFYKKMLLEEKEDEDYEDTIRLVEKELTDLIYYKLECMDLELKAAPLENSRKNMSFWSRVDQKKMLPEEMQYHKMYQAMSEDTNEDYIHKVSELYINMDKTNRSPKYQDCFTEFDMNKIMLNANKEMIKANMLRKRFLKGGDKEPRRVPKMLPFPLMTLDYEMEKMNSYNNLGNYNLDYEILLDDGTMLISSDLDFSEKKKEEVDEKENQEYAVDGIGVDDEEDIEKVDDLIEFMMEREMWEDSTLKFGGFPQDEYMMDLYHTKLWKTVDFYSQLAENMCYLEGRRFYREDKKDMKARGYTVAKSFKKYTLLIKRGSRLTKEKQLRFKIITSEKNSLTSNIEDFKPLKKVNEMTDLVESNWLTISSPMMKHYLKLREVVALLYSSMRDKYVENNRGRAFGDYKMDKTFVSMVLIMMEGKRGTSTTVQLNRYLLHSATSYITNREALVRDIMSDPIRTRLEAYHRSMQMKWYIKMLHDSEMMWTDRLSKMLTNDNEYDRFKTWSPYDLTKKVEFSTLIDCIYACNLFEKGTGFIEHRVKSIMSKMVAAERHFLKIKEEKESMGRIDNLVEFWNKKEELHTFDAKWYIAATKRFFSKGTSKIEVNLAIEEAMSETINAAMMMTSSLTAGPLPSKGLKYSKDVEKTKAFISIFEEIEELNTNNLLELVSKYDEVEAVFALFPKAQIGGPREILIQSVRLRLMVKFLEVFSAKLCSLHPKEMLTKDHLKSQLQSEYTNNIREEQRELASKNVNSVSLSFNMDASKWAPGFVMEQFYVMVLNMDIPDKIKNVLLSVVSAFSCKFMFTPESLKNKWSNMPVDMKEGREDLEWFRIKGMSQSMIVEILSGMGQGMLHRMSSLMACFTDDASDISAKEIISKLDGVKVKSQTLLSSDDKTKFLLFYGNVPNEKLNSAVKNYSKCWDLLTRMSNIHINWKKSGMNFIITEFNSLFSIGRRMSWASIKDIYNTFNIPDLTWPENAVQDMMSNLRRCLEHGLYMTSITTAAKMIRSQIRRYYRLDKETMESLMKKLDCTEDRLPFHLGFFPVTNLYSKLIMGKEVSMFSSMNSEKLKSFYIKMYSAKKNKEDSKMKSYIPFSEDSRGRFWMMINMKMDKSLKDMKKDFFNNKLNMTMDQIMKEMDKLTMNINLPMNDWKSHKKFTLEYFVGMNRNYEFNDTMPIHSLVRALQYSGRKATIMPKTNYVLELEDQLEKVNEKIKFCDWMYDEDRDKLMTNKKELEMSMDKTKVDMLDFVEHVMVAGEDLSSNLELYSALDKLEDEEEEFNNTLESYPITYKYLHSTMKKIRFYVSPMGMSVSGKELLTHLFEEKFPSSNRLITTTSNLFKLNLKRKTNPLMENIYQNPFLFIKNLMSGSNHPFKDFHDYMKDTFKNMKYMEMNLVSDFSCSGNFSDNIKKLMMTRGNPQYVKLFPSNKFTKDQTALTFLTKITMADYKNIEVEDPGNMVEMLHRDVKLDRARKMYNATRYNKEKNLDTSMVYSDRIEYTKTVSKSKDMINHFWTDYNVVIVGKEHKNFVNFYIFSTFDLDKDERNDRKIFHVFDKFKTEMKSLGKNMRNLTFTTLSSRYSIQYTIMEFQLRTQVQRLFKKWRIVLMFLPTRDNAMCNIYDFYNTQLILFEDEYTADYNTMMNMKFESGEEEFYTLRQMMNEIPYIEDLDKILVKYDLLPEIHMPISQNKSDTEKHLDVQDILKQFNEAASSTGMIGNMARMFRVMEYNSDSEDEGDMETSEKDDLEEDMLQGYIKDSVIKKMEDDRDNIDINPLIVGMNKMKELYLKEDKDELEDEMIFEDQRIGSKMKRTKMAKITTELMKRSIETSIDYDKRKMRRVFDSFKRNGNEVGFHNMLVLQINSIFDFSLSDSMVMFLYNHFLAKMSTMYIIKPTYKVIKYGPEKNNLLTDSLMFLHKKEELDDTLEEAINEF
jgi:hypothetical protein